MDPYGSLFGSERGSMASSVRQGSVSEKGGEGRGGKQWRSYTRAYTGLGPGEVHECPGKNNAES